MSDEAYTFHPACKLSDIEDDRGVPVEVGDRIIAIFRTDGEFFAIDDACPTKASHSAMALWIRRSSPAPGTDGASAWNRDAAWMGSNPPSQNIPCWLKAILSKSGSRKVLEKKPPRLTQNTNTI